MQEWREAWHIVKHELSKSWIALVLSVLLYMYFAIVVGPTAWGDWPGGSWRWQNAWIDFMYISFMPVMGFVLNRTMLRVLQDDSFTRQLVYYRSLPIPYRVVIKGRMLQVLLMLPINATGFFIIQYLLVAQFRALGWSEFIGFALCWAGYGIAVAATYIYWEQLYSGKQYFIISFLYVVGYLLVVTVLQLLGWNITFILYEASTAMKFTIAGIMLSLGLATMAIVVKGLARQLPGRSLI